MGPTLSLQTWLVPCACPASQGKAMTLCTRGCQSIVSWSWSMKSLTAQWLNTWSSRSSGVVLLGRSNLFADFLALVSFKQSCEWQAPIFHHNRVVLKVDGSLARNIDFEVANFQVLRKTRRKTSILQLYKVWKLEEVSHEMLVLVLPPVSSRVSFPWPRRVYGGSCKTSPFVMLPTVKIGGSLVGNAGFSASTCLVSSCWFSCGVAVSMGEAGKPVLFECFQAGCHVVLRGSRGTFWHSNLFDDVHKISKLEEVS